MTARPRFHLSFCVTDLESTRAFYVQALACREGKLHPSAVDFSFYGHQLTCHIDPPHVRGADAGSLDGNHFGAIVDEAEFHRAVARLEAAGARFIVPPTVQQQGTSAERWRAIVADPSGNAIEIKCYRDEAQLYGP